jgi:3-dehydroquinate synthase
MTYAAIMSQQIRGFKDAEAVIALLAKYGLPTFADFDKKKAFKTLQMDKKKQAQGINYVLLQKIGKGVIQPLSFQELETILNQF